MQVTLASDVPADVVAAGPSYVTGLNGVVDVGSQRTNVLVYAPRGALVDSVTRGGEPVGVTSQFHADLHAVGLTITLGAGEVTQLEYRIDIGPGQTGHSMIRTTPVNALLTTVQKSCAPQEVR